MNYNPNFDVDAVLERLRGVNEKYQEGSPEDEAIRIAAVALFYVRETQKLDDYREFFRSFYTPAIDYIKVSRTFTTREEADTGLPVVRPGKATASASLAWAFGSSPSEKGRDCDSSAHPCRRS
ncbi:hypothetical protein ACN28S_07635 [Cystobacter fuscus]